MSYGQNDILYNIANDEDKDYRITVYMQEGLYRKIEAYRQEMDLSWSDAAGDLIKEAFLAREKKSAWQRLRNIV